MEISGSRLGVDWNAVAEHLLDAIDVLPYDDNHIDLALKDIEDNNPGLAFQELRDLFCSISSPETRGAMAEHLRLAAQEMRLPSNELNF